MEPETPQSPAEPLNPGEKLMALLSGLATSAQSFGERLLTPGWTQCQALMILGLALFCWGLGRVSGAALDRTVRARSGWQARQLRGVIDTA
ncbi:MAG: hypothetical protein AAFY38_05625 [Pseudomonadota bacterium]